MRGEGYGGLKGVGGEGYGGSERDEGGNEGAREGITMRV